jgi:hypothetical protein
MTKHKIAGLFWFVALFAFVAPVLAHHAFTAEYDSNKKLVLKGTLTRVDWINPHVFLYVDVKDTAGKVTNWAIETGPPTALHRYGAKRNMFVEGQTITVECYPAKDGTRALAGLRHVTFQDGTEFNYRDPDVPADKP